MWGEKHLILSDEINRSTSNKAKAYFHLHSSVKKPLVDGNTIILESSGVSIEFERASTIMLKNINYQQGLIKLTWLIKL